MKTFFYHVWFSAESELAEDELLDAVAEFMTEQLKSNFAVQYQLHRFTNKAGSESLTDFQLIVEYASETDQQRAMERMKDAYRDEPHASIMRLTGDFRVAFSGKERP